MLRSKFGKPAKVCAGARNLLVPHRLSSGYLQRTMLLLYRNGQHDAEDSGIAEGCYCGFLKMPTIGSDVM